MDLDSWFEDREIQEFIEKLEKKTNKTTFKSNLQSQQIKKESTKIIQNSDNSSLAQNIASKLDDLVDGMKNSSDDLRKEVITELKSVSKSIKDLDKK